MSTINISDLSPTGSDLFSDSETYMNELTNDELSLVSGGDAISAIGGALFSAGAVLVSFGLSTPICSAVVGTAVGSAAISVFVP